MLAGLNTEVTEYNTEITEEIMRYGCFYLNLSVLCACAPKCFGTQVWLLCGLCVKKV